MAENGALKRYKSRRSRVLWEITALVVVVYVIGGFATFLIASNSYSRLAKASTDKLIDEKARTISSSYDYLAKTEMEIILSTYGVENIHLTEFYEKLQAANYNDLDPLQVFLAEKFQEMKEAGLLGLQYIFMVLPNPITRDLVIFVSNDRSRIYMEFPEEITQAIKGGDPWLLLEEGFPELGLEGAQLVTFSKVASPVQSDVMMTFVGVTPMGADIAEINKFYDDEKKDTMVNYAIVTLISLVVIIALTFFGLRYLIRKRITEPIDILSGEAEEVMEGNLDLDIVVHEGGEFESLESAFREMVVSFRTYLARSIEED